MLSQTIDPAKPTAHTDLFFYINLLHSIPLAYGIRHPLAVYHIIKCHQSSQGLSAPFAQDVSIFDAQKVLVTLLG
jgi:hypothetical protein